MKLKELINGGVRGEVDPNDPDVRSAADEVWELAALNNLKILGAEKKVTPNGEVQYYDLQSGEWKTVGRI